MLVHILSPLSDEDDNSNSSNDSDLLQGGGGRGTGGGYHRGSHSDGGGSKTVCRHESISLTAIEDCPTDHEVKKNYHMANSSTISA